MSLNYIKKVGKGPDNHQVPNDKKVRDKLQEQWDRYWERVEDAPEEDIKAAQSEDGKT